MKKDYKCCNCSVWLVRRK